jgi:hypothetical protein
MFCAGCRWGDDVHDTEEDQRCRADRRLLWSRRNDGARFSRDSTVIDVNSWNATSEREGAEAQRGVRKKGA